MQSFTDLLLPYDLPTTLPLDEGGKDLYKAATISDCFSNKITKASHKSAFPGTRLKTQTHMPLPENDHVMKAIHCLSTDEVLMKSQHQQVNYVSEMEAVGQWLFCGVCVFFRSLLLKFWRKDQEDIYNNSCFADAPEKQQHLQLVSHLLTRGVRNKHKDNDPSDLTLSEFVLW